MHGHLSRTIKIRQDRGADQHDSGAILRSFEKIYIFSPSVNIDKSWIPVKKYIEEDLGVNTEREQAYCDEWDEAALRGIIQRQRKITETVQEVKMKKLYQVLIILDNYADSPQLHIRGRHMQISTCSQKLRLISAAVRVNMQFLCCWRLHNQHSGRPKDKLRRIYEQRAALARGRAADRAGQHYYSHLSLPPSNAGAGYERRDWLPVNELGGATRHPGNPGSPKASTI